MSISDKLTTSHHKSILRTLRKQGPLARIDLGTSEGLSPATLTSLTADMIKSGLIVETQQRQLQSSGRGRPKVLLDLNPSAAHVIGVKLAIGVVEIFLADYKGGILESEKHYFDTLDWTETDLINHLVHLITDFKATRGKGADPHLPLGIAAQGIIDARLGRIVWSPAFNFRNIALADLLGQRLETEITLSNDANCIALALKQKDQFRHKENIAVAALGYGIGMGLIVNGDFFTGAGEFGHTKYMPDGALCNCGQRGCIEAYIGDYALLRDAVRFMPKHDQTYIQASEDQMKVLTQMAKDAYPEALTLFERAGRILGQGLGNVIAMFSPETIIITGPGVRSYSFMEQSVHRTIKESVIHDLHKNCEITAQSWESDLIHIGLAHLTLATFEAE